MAYNNNRFGGERSFDRPTMHRAVCDSCRKECEVPFRPTGSKPIFCRDCFSQNGGPDSRSDSRRSSGSDFRRSGDRDRQMHDAVCDSCAKNCKIPFQPTEGRPIFCSDCFETNGQTSPRNFGGGKSEKSGPSYKQQFEELNAKMDKILALLSSTDIKKVKASSNPSADSELGIVEEDVTVEEPKAASAESFGEPKKKPKTKATLAAKKKAAKKSPKKK